MLTIKLWLYLSKINTSILAIFNKLISEVRMLVKYCEDEEISSLNSQEASLSWNEFVAGPNLFEGCVTLNPEEVMVAWEKLGQDTFLTELASVPELLRFAILKSIEEYSNNKEDNE